MLTTPVRRKLYEYVVEEIGLRIIRGDYQPGETLPNEDGLCAEFNVSRGVLREAAKVLGQKGLIQSRPKTGTQVQPRSSWNLFDADVLIWKLKVGNRFEFLRNVTEVRRIIESEAARYAAQRATEPEITRVASLMARMTDALSDGESYRYQTYLKIDMDFHVSILDACHNDLLCHMGYTMRHAVHTARHLDVTDFTTQAASLPFHQEICRAIRQRDGEAAYRAAQRLFDHVWANMPTVEPATDGERQM